MASWAPWTHSLRCLLQNRNAIPQQTTHGVWKVPIHDHRKSESNSSLRVTSESKKISSKSMSALVLFELIFTFTSDSQGGIWLSWEISIPHLSSVGEWYIKLIKLDIRNIILVNKNIFNLCWLLTVTVDLWLCWLMTVLTYDYVDLWLCWLFTTLTSL